MTQAATKKPVKNDADPFTGFKKAEEAVKPDGYWDPEGGNILYGGLMTAFEYIQKTGKSRGKPRVVYIFKLLAPTMATVDGGKDTRELQKGDVCAVFDTHGLRVLRELAGCEVKLRRKPEKTLLKNGNEMWEYDLGYKGAKKPLVIRQSFAAPAPDADDVDDANENWEDAF